MLRVRRCSYWCSLNRLAYTVELYSSVLDLLSSILVWLSLTFLNRSLAFFCSQFIIIVCFKKNLCMVVIVY